VQTWFQLITHPQLRSKRRSRTVVHPLSRQLQPVRLCFPHRLEYLPSMRATSITEPLRPGLQTESKDSHLSMYIGVELPEILKPLNQSCFVPHKGQCANHRRIRERHRRHTFVRPRLTKGTDVMTRRPATKLPNIFYPTHSFASCLRT
jgi:hypothetical protein